MDRALLNTAFQALLDAGFLPVDVPVLLTMDDFVRISGEEFRRRIFVTSDNRGNDFCLRPEFTIPVCRQALAHGETGGRLAYSGKVFLNGEAGEPKELWQLGAEIIGAHDPAEADAEALKRALASVATFTGRMPRILIGDIALFRALLESLHVPPAWARRLLHQFGNARKVSETLDHMGDVSSTFQSFRTHRDVVEALSRFPSEAVGDLFAEVLAIAGVRTVGGRSPAEIAERVVEQATLAAQGVIPDSHANLIRRLLAVDGTVAEALDQLLPIARQVNGAFSEALAAFNRRVRAMTAAGLSLQSARFSGHFGRQLGYYDGFVFDLLDETGALIAGGGRYDETATRLGQGRATRAIGFALFPERF